MKLDYLLYMAESEGFDNWVTTDLAKINASIKDFVKYHNQNYDINDEMVQRAIFKKHKLSLDNISDKQMEYIAKEVEKRIL